MPLYKALFLVTPQGDEPECAYEIRLAADDWAHAAQEVLVMIEGIEGIQNIELALALDQEPVSAAELS